MTASFATYCTFRLRHSVERPEFEAADRDFAAELAGFDGFVSRVLAESVDGCWTETVLWRSPEAAQAADARFGGMASAPALLAAMDPASVQRWTGIVATSTRAMSSARGALKARAG